MSRNLRFITALMFLLFVASVQAQVEDPYAQFAWQAGPTQGKIGDKELELLVDWLVGNYFR